MTLTTEQLRARAESLGLDFFIERRAGIWVKEWFGNGCTSATAEEVMMWSMLANREAQPVLYASEETLAYAKEGEKRLVTWSEPMGDAVIPLFTVPKAQTSGVVNLPTEFISDEGVMVRLEQVMAALALVGVKYERRGDACRAAMLENIDKPAPQLDSVVTRHANQPVSRGYKLADDTRRMNWLVAHHVTVRKPLRYGSEAMFTAQTITDEEDDYHATKLREQIDAAMLAAAPGDS
ncbi:hypothetical protein [Serratia surfactantfaciens]|uniref:hypothetical protein n=1 Tax=Serratia surfactantfaciens TaxID=2741499 RepID=UPI001B3C7473|nr:hypothetical protein [Serratia surfactantfaciens]